MSKKENEVRVEKIFNQPAKTVFQALAEGRLFNNCGAVMDQLEIDFRKGGKYKLSFPNAEAKLCGKFLEIVPDKKISFTWGDEGSDAGFPLTDVSVELFADGQKTRLVILHTGFTKKEDVDSHQHGWNSGLDDLSAELEQGRIRIIRVYSANKDRLFQACSNPQTFFGQISDVAKGEVDFRVGGQYKFPTEKGEIFGKFEEIIPGKKIVFSWLSGCGARFDRDTRVTLAFDDEDEGGSSVELTHEFLPTSSVKNHREGWEYLTQKLYAVLK